MDPWSFIAIANGLLSEPSPHRMLWCWVKQVTWGNNKRLINLLNIYLLIFSQLSLDVHSLIWEDSGKKLWEWNGKLSTNFVVKTWVTPWTIYNWMSKVKQDCFVFALHWPVTGPENMYLPFNQSNAKLKPNKTYPHLCFSCPLGTWLIKVFSFFLTGCWD